MMTKNESAQPQLPPLQVDLETLRRWADGMGYGDLRPTRLVAQDLLAYVAENESLKAALEQAKAQIVQGDGSCDRCGRVPAIVMSTSLCNDCIDGVKRAEKAEAERDKALEVVREYREGLQVTTHRFCLVRKSGLAHGTQIDDRCPTCIKADALLSRETKEA